MLDLVIDARTATLGPGLQVKRILPFRQRRMVGPFIFLDHAGPIDVPPVTAHAMDVLPHPHIGLSTVSYLFGGRVTHRDSLGVEQVIRPGEVNWMTAGSGIAHSERFEDPAALTGGLEMVQTWVALPERDEESAPSFANYTTDALPVYTDGGLWMRLIAGTAYGLSNDVKTHSPLFYLHAVLQPGTRFTLPREHAERAVYIAKGSLETGGQRYGLGQLLVLTRGADPVLSTTEGCTVLLLGGEPVGDRYIWWNFVSSRKERIEQAKADWAAGRILLPPTDNEEYVPLPNDRSKPAGGPAPQALS